MNRRSALRALLTAVVAAPALPGILEAAMAPVAKVQWYGVMSFGSVWAGDVGRIENVHFIHVSSE